MDKWITHLIEDMKNAHRIPAMRDEGITKEPQSIEEHFAEVERWLESEPQFTFSQFCGIHPEQFPPQNMLKN